MVTRSFRLWEYSKFRAVIQGEFCIQCRVGGEGGAWMRRYTNRRGGPVKTGPIQSPKAIVRKAYMPDVEPFMRQYGYKENLEDILRDVDKLPRNNHFYYEQGDLWHGEP